MNLRTAKGLDETFIRLGLTVILFLFSFLCLLTGYTLVANERAAWGLTLVVSLRRDGDRLIAELRGNLPDLLMAGSRCIRRLRIGPVGQAGDDYAPSKPRA